MDEPDSFPFNRDFERRNAMLQPFLSTEGPFAELGVAANIFYFRDVPAEVVARLLAERFMDPDQRQNASPSSAEFLAFMQRHPGVLAHGYATSIEREDYRVSIEGVSYTGAASDELRRDAVRLFGSADECRVDGAGLYVWYD
jgi:hypothetical protein